MARGDRRPGSASLPTAASTRAASPQSHSSYSAMKSASLPGKYRYGVPLDTPAASATSAIVVAWYPDRAKLQLGQLMHPLQVRLALEVQETGGGAAQHHREQHLGEQDAVQARLGRGRLRQPPFHLRGPSTGD